MFLNSFNHFRAIAIIIIVMGHSFFLGNIKFESDLEKLILNLISGGTTLFVFISGYLFHYVFFRKYNFRNFIKKKTLNVLIPYLILGCFPIFTLVYKGYDGFDGFFLPIEEGFFYEKVIPIIQYYWTGRFLIGYWYIPFIMITFLLSPFHIKFINQTKRIQILIIGIFLFISLCIHRPYENLFVFHSVLYFTPIYLLGIFISIHNERIYYIFKNKDFFFLFIALLIAYIEVLISNNVNNEYLEFIKYFDITLIQKIFLSIFFMLWLHRFENYHNKFIHLIASTSFAIFFLHPIFLHVLKKIHYFNTIKPSWFFYGIFVIIILFICILIAKIIKKIMPNYSRYIIGY